MSMISDDAGGSIEVKESEQDATMKDSFNAVRNDREVDATEDAEQKMYQIIQRLTTRLSTVQEE